MRSEAVTILELHILGNWKKYIGFVFARVYELRPERKWYF
jgi:hypothetical protein